MHTVKPIDEEAIISSAREIKHIITVEEHNKLGGLGSSVAEVIAKNNLDCKLICIAIDDAYSAIVGSQEYLRSYYRLDHVEIIRKAQELLK